MTTLPMILTAATVAEAQRLSPAFQRVWLSDPALAEFGVDGPLFDQRIKLIFPNAEGKLSSFADADESWFGTWLDRPVAERGPMRTYTVRDVRGVGTDTQIAVDIVLHGRPGDADLGPGAQWAMNVQAGDRVSLMAPRRGYPYGGIEFVPGEATSLLLVADETAVPAVAAILQHLPEDSTGTAVLEVPTEADVLDLSGPSRVEIIWLPRDGRAIGERIHETVLARLGAARPVEPAEDEVDPDLWETPSYSSSGEDVAGNSPHPGLYAWIAGESRMVTTLRRALVGSGAGQLGMDRSQVAFMGYWRQGVAMRS